MIYGFDQFPPGSDATTVNLEAVSLLQLSTWDWSDRERDLVTIALMLKPTDTLRNYRRVGIVHIPNYNGLAVNGGRRKISRLSKGHKAASDTCLTPTLFTSRLGGSVGNLS